MTHVWVIDAIEEGIARIEEDGAVLLSVPLRLLPAGARAGAVFRVTRTGGPGSSTVTIVTDAGAERAAREASARQVGKLAARSRRRDPGGDVGL